MRSPTAQSDIRIVLFVFVFDLSDRTVARFHLFAFFASKKPTTKSTMLFFSLSLCRSFYCHRTVNICMLFLSLSEKLQSGMDGCAGAVAGLGVSR